MKMAPSTFLLAEGSVGIEARALRAALRKIELAEGLIDRLLTCDMALDDAQRVAGVRAEIRSISKLIRDRLETGT